jgi:hypothetical protein
MATSGSIDFNMSAREVITYALRKINILAETEDPGADQAARAMTELNVMLKGWQKHENLWRLTEGSVALTDATASYSLSPIPHRVVSVRYRNTGGTDLPMEEMSRQEYYDLPLKTSAGTPTSYYVDYQRATVTLFVWPVLADATTETFKHTYQRKFEDIDALDNDIDIKQEHFEVVGYNLAARMADDYGRKGEHISRIIARAEMLLQDALDDDRETSIQFVPGPR